MYLWRRAQLDCADCCIAGCVYGRQCHEATLSRAVADDVEPQRSGRLALDLHTVCINEHRRVAGVKLVVLRGEAAALHICTACMKHDHRVRHLLVNPASAMPTCWYVTLALPRLPGAM
jgi:hypothetical protein